MPPNAIAIDGPAGAGKSTTARAVADRLGFGHLDSGALYRALTLAAIDREIPLTAGQRIAALATELPVRLDAVADGFRPEVAGVDVQKAVRRADVTANVSAVAALEPVRVVVNQMIRAAADRHHRGVVVEGRDIGSTVLPDARLKVYLSAAPEERARRRLLQDGRPLDADTVVQEVAALLERDRQDETRAVSPLRRADGAVDVDTSGKPFEDQVTEIVDLARKAFPSLDIA